MTWDDLVKLAETQSIAVRPLAGLAAIFGSAPPFSAQPSTMTISVEPFLLARLERTRKLNARAIGAFLHEVGHIVDFKERGIDEEIMLPLYQRAATNHPLSADEQTAIMTAELNAWAYARLQAAGLGYRIPRWFIAACLGSYIGAFMVAQSKPKTLTEGGKLVWTIVADAWRLSRA